MLSHMAADIICRYFCLSLITMCRNGFSFVETDFRQRILGNEASNEVFDDFAKFYLKIFFFVYFKIQTSYLKKYYFVVFF